MTESETAGSEQQTEEAEESESDSEITDIGADEFDDLVEQAQNQDTYDEESGLELHDVLEQVRMTQAKHLLETTNIKITDLYVAVGYNNLTSFRRAFKKKYGVAPNALRE